MADNVVKSQPTAAQLHIDRPLTDVSVAYIQEQKAFIADTVFKPVKSDKQSNLYYKFKKEYFFQGGADLQIAEGSPTKMGGFGLETDSYFIKEYGFSTLVTDEARANVDDPISLDQTATILVTQRLLTAKERMFADTVWNKTAWAHSLEGAAESASGKFVFWDDYENSNPITDIRNAKITVKKSTGYTPNVLILSRDVFEKLINHTKIIDRYKYTTNQVITQEMLAKLFDLERIEITDAIALPETYVEGSSTVGLYDFIMNNGALLLYVPKTAGIMQPAAGYEFFWTGLAGVGSSGNGIVVKTYRKESLRADKVEALMAFQFKVVCADLGFFFKGCLSA